VWVVKTIRFRTSFHASAKLSPFDIRSAIISIPAKTACPSLKW
jgi:hypothetical protein